MALCAFAMQCRNSLSCTLHKVPLTVLRSQKQKLCTKVRHSRLKKFEKKTLEFEMDTGIKEDILLFSYPKKEKTNAFYSIGSLFIGLCCVNSAHLIFTTMKDLQPPIQTDGKQPWYMWWQHFYIGHDVVPKGLAVIILLTGVAVIWVTHANISHQVKSLTLLRGGEKVLIEHYGFLGRTAQREVPLKEITALPTRQQIKEYISVKVKGDRLNYYIELNGTFHDRKLFNSTVGLLRKFDK